MQDEYRRARREWILAIPGHKVALEEALRGALDPGERLEAISVGRWFGRALTGRRLMLVSGSGETGPMSLESFSFDELEGWHLGWTHDERPYVELRHPTRLRPAHAPAHRVLWFEWGNRTVFVPRATTTIRFSTRRDPVFRALLSTLEGLGLVRGATIHERPEGSREDRAASSLVIPYIRRRRAFLRRGGLRRPSRFRPRGPIPPG